MASKRFTKSQRDRTIAHVFLEEYGSTSYLPVRWKGYAYAITDYAPEWLSESDLNAEPDQCVTVLDFGGISSAPKGWTEVYRYAAGERECPWCGPGCENCLYVDGKPSPDPKCKLCEGDGLLYWGEDCKVVVFAPGYIYGSGSAGCMYDNGPHRCASVRDACDALSETFQDLPARALQRMRGDLKRHGIHYFPNTPCLDPHGGSVCAERTTIRALAGADYCEVKEG